MALSDLNIVERNEVGIATVLGILKQRFGERLQTGAALRAQHAHTTTYIPTQPPDAVVFAARLKMCRRSSRRARSTVSR